MSLERIGATELLNRHVSALRGRILELGVGDDPYRRLFESPPVTVDIEFSNRPQVVADAHHLPFRASAFDSVLASQVFEHLHSPWEAVAELHRVTRDGDGAIVVAVPFLFPLHQEPHDYFRYTVHGLTRLFGQYFTIDHAISYGGRAAVAVEMLFTPTASSTFARRALRKVRKALIGLDRGRQHPVIGRALLRRPSGEHPLGYLVVCRPSQRSPAPDGTLA